jgi:Asp-tRNA(Asn)/Glu-tRNA(Gln) amidotransferase A subunit family amidase
MTGPNDLPELDPFSRFIAAYARKQQIGTARGRWPWALAKVGNDHERIIRAAELATAWHLKQGTALNFIPLPHKWLDAEGWLDSFELPPAPVRSEYDDLKAVYDRWWSKDTPFVRKYRDEQIPEAMKRRLEAAGFDLRRAG